jgi:hypothetical protein
MKETPSGLPLSLSFKLESCHIATKKCPLVPKIMNDETPEVFQVKSRHMTFTVSLIVT